MYNAPYIIFLLFLHVISAITIQSQVDKTCARMLISFKVTQIKNIKIYWLFTKVYFCPSLAGSHHTKLSNSVLS